MTIKYSHIFNTANLVVPGTSIGLLCHRCGIGYMTLLTLAEKIEADNNDTNILETAETYLNFINRLTNCISDDELIIKRLLE